MRVQDTSRIFGEALGCVSFLSFALKKRGGACQSTIPKKAGSFFQEFFFVQGRFCFLLFFGGGIQQGER